MKKVVKKTIKNTKKVEKEKYVTLDIFNKAMKNIDARFVSVDKKFEAIDKRFEKIDQRFEKIDQRFEKIDERFEAVDKRFDIMDQKFEDFTITILSGVETMLKEQTFRIEALFEDKKYKDKIYFKDGLNNQDFKIKDLSKRVEK